MRRSERQQQRGQRFASPLSPYSVPHLDAMLRSAAARVSRQAIQPRALAP